MEYRNGKCSSCGAEYKIPASFAHDVARCKECGGSVQIAALAGKPKPALAKPPAPQPVAKPAPAPAAQAEPEKKGGTLERLKRERAAEADKQAGAKPAAARPSVGRQATVPQRAARPTPAAAKPSTRGKKAGAARGAATGAAVGAAAGGSKRRSSRSGGSSRREKPEKKAPVGAIIGIFAVVGLGAGAFFFKDQLFGDRAPTETQAKEEFDTTNTLDPTPTKETPAKNEALTPTIDPTTDDPASADPTGEASTDPPADTAETPGDEVDPFAETKKKPETKAPDPDSVDLLSLADFGPAKATSDAEWDQMQEDIAVWMDPYAGAAGNRSKARVKGLGYKAIPAIMNRLKAMDFSTDSGQENGNQCQAALREICNGLNFNWQDGTEPKDVVFNKKVVKAWAGLWDDASTDVDKLIRMLKLEPESPEANEVRVAYGEEPVDITPEAEEDSGGGDEDDFEID